MVITRGRWSSASTSMLSVSACRRAITCAWHCCGSNRVTSGLPTTRPESSEPLRADETDNSGLPQYAAFTVAYYS
jgi:hypothetical protein